MLIHPSIFTRHCISQLIFPKFHLFLIYTINSLFQIVRELLLTTVAVVKVYCGRDGVLLYIEQSRWEHADPFIKKSNVSRSRQNHATPLRIAHILCCVCTHMFMHVYVFASVNLSDGFDQFMPANCEIHLSLNMFYLNVALTVFNLTQLRDWPRCCRFTHTHMLVSQ